MNNTITQSVYFMLLPFIRAKILGCVQMKVNVRYADLSAVLHTTHAAHAHVSHDGNLQHGGWGGEVTSGNPRVKKLHA